MQSAASVQSTSALDSLGKRSSRADARAAPNRHGIGEPESGRIRPQALTNNDHGGIAAADGECTISQEQHQFP
jgi:hypothetical protein